jgi:excisionase family DNA binding protein
MTLTQAATTLGVTAGSLRHQIASGSLRAMKVGRDWHVTKAEVERYRRDSLGRPGRRQVSSSQSSRKALHHGDG